ncbi:MAG TPA: S41 family peptidase [Pyrinomonadaceae bacterium]
MKRLRLISLLFISLLPFAFFLLPSSATRNATNARRLAVFDDVWETVRDRYYDPTFNGLDWQAERERFRPLAAKAQSTAELYAILRRMLGALHDAHTRVFAPGERFNWQHPRFISVGIFVREIEGVPVIVAVEKGSEAERAGLRAGDVLTSVDGEDALKVFARRLSEQVGSSTTHYARLQAMAKLFEGERNTLVKVGWVGMDGKERQTTLKRKMTERDAVLQVRRVRERVGLIEFNVFTLSNAVGFMRTLDGKLRDVRALIIDLRRNGGGETEALTEIASAFLPAGKSLGRFTDRSGRTQFEPHTRSAMLFAPDAIKNFRGAVIILTSEQTSSAAEIFVAALKEARRATVIGENTCGCVLAIRRRHMLPDGGVLDVSEMDYRTAAGARLEGAGLAPDEKVTLERQDLRARRDRALERAIEQLTSELSNP